MNIAVPQSTIAWEAASRALAAALGEAGQIGVRINVAVVDRGGLLIGFLRSPGAPLHSVDIAIDKAYTAASFGLPTGQWSEVLRSHSEGVQRGIPLRPRFVIFGGGLPLRVEGEVVGGIGVSGASEEQDEQCALAGLRAIGLA
ncbi:MAG: hypothetical protein RIR00_2566 [Pseudomonadota bacterium]